jgi:hypothetical protein
MLLGDRIHKSTKGHTALASRSMELPAPLRTLLLMIYGDKTAAQYFELASRLPVGREGFQQLLDIGLIEVVPTLGSIAGLAQAGQPASREPLSAPMSDVVALKATHTLDEAAQQKLLYPEFVRAVADLGLRGFMLQMKVERAMSATELLALRAQVEAALGKSKGESARLEFSARLDVLLAKFYWS